MKLPDLESRVAALEGSISARDELDREIKNISEIVELIHGVLSDLVKDLPNAEEYRSDLERIDTLGRLL